MSVSVVLYKNLGVSNAAIAFFTAGCICRGSSNHLWSPVVDILKTRRLWIWAMQLSHGRGSGRRGADDSRCRISSSSRLCFLAVGFRSATHDIAADGFYMLALTEHQQAFFSGLRNAFYSVAKICAQGRTGLLAGELHGTGNLLRHGRRLSRSWREFFGPGRLSPVGSATPGKRCTGRCPGIQFAKNFLRPSPHFFTNRKSACCSRFLLLYRFAEAQLVKVVQIFLLDPRGNRGAWR